jgi:hypothetical protein|tara:strand:- start:133 stop:435 length:303 start_codon:yes stop_codon:yes gene_type:complete
MTKLNCYITIEEWGKLYEKLEEEGFSFKTTVGAGCRKVEITSIGKSSESYGEVRYSFEEHISEPYHFHTSCDHIAEIAIPIIYGSPSSLESLFMNTKKEL